MTFRIFMAIMLMGAGINGVGGMSLGHERSLMDECRSVWMDFRKLVGVPIPLDPCLDSIVLPDGKSLMTGTFVLAPPLNLLRGGYNDNEERRGFYLANKVYATYDIDEHGKALKELAELAGKGNLSALRCFESLFAPEPEGSARELPWTNKNLDRSRWFKKVSELKDTQLFGKTREDKEQAELALRRALSYPESSVVLDTERDRFGAVGSRKLARASTLSEDRKTK